MRQFVSLGDLVFAQVCTATQKVSTGRQVHQHRCEVRDPVFQGHEIEALRRHRNKLERTEADKYIKSDTKICATLRIMLR